MRTVRANLDRANLDRANPEPALGSEAPHMDIRFSEEDERFRAEIAGWLDAQLSGPFAAVKGRGGPGVTCRMDPLPTLATGYNPGSSGLSRCKIL